jgi:hypothetical protein
MSKPTTCKQCGGGNLHHGTVDAFQPVIFRPTGPNEFLPKSVTLEAWLCSDCGAVQLSADEASLKAFGMRP